MIFEFIQVYNNSNFILNQLKSNKNSYQLKTLSGRIPYWYRVRERKGIWVFIFILYEVLENLAFRAAIALHIAKHSR